MGLINAMMYYTFSNIILIAKRNYIKDFLIFGGFSIFLRFLGFTIISDISWMFGCTLLMLSVSLRILLYINPDIYNIWKILRDYSMELAKEKENDNLASN